MPFEVILMPLNEGLSEKDVESTTHPGFVEVVEVSMVGGVAPIIVE